MIADFDHLDIRCPLLGHPLTFSYCRSANPVEPCRKILDCWFTRFDVEGFVRENFPKETLEKIVCPPKPKMLSILEIARRAMAAQKSSDKSGDSQK